MKKLINEALKTLKDCSTCEHKKLSGNPKHHCYMFEERPRGCNCGAYMPVANPLRNLLESVVEGEFPCLT
jgi:hypothetical protein